jgi:hypothetical protein
VIYRTEKSSFETCFQKIENNYKKMASLKITKFGMMSSRAHSCVVLINHLTTEPELFERGVWSSPAERAALLPRKPPACAQKSNRFTIVSRVFVRKVLRHVE